ncbi:MAG: LytTR family DNA-binding domain-containing protein [Bacteroidales bacterium]
MIRTIIIDDEASARTTLKQLLSEHCPQIEVVAEGSSVGEGLKIIGLHHPELVFLDVQMPDGTGFDLLRKLEKVDFRVVFASAYDRFAIDAFRFSAVDYLLKPVEAEKLIEACQRLNQPDDKYDLLNRKVEVLLANTRTGVEKIALPTFEGILFVRISDIVRCESDNNYTRFFLNDKREILVSRTLKEYDELLSPYRFFRIHKSHLINLDYLEKYRKGEGGSVIMEDGAELEVSRRRKEDFMAALQQL